MPLCARLTQAYLKPCFRFIQGLHVLKCVYWNRRVKSVSWSNVNKGILRYVYVALYYCERKWFLSYFPNVLLNHDRVKTHIHSWWWIVMNCNNVFMIMNNILQVAIHLMSSADLWDETRHWSHHSQYIICYSRYRWVSSTPLFTCDVTARFCLKERWDLCNSILGDRKYWSRNFILPILSSVETLVEKLSQKRVLWIVILD